MKLISCHGINEQASNAATLKLAWDTVLFGKSNPETVMAFWGDLSIAHQKKMALSIQDDVLCEILKVGSSNILLQDVENYFYNDAIRSQIQQRFIDVLPTDGEPVIILGHSLGSTITYEVLLDKAPDNLNVEQYITIGCPNGLAVVQAEFRRLHNIPTGRLPVPKSVKKWNNYSDPLDPVALQHQLDALFSPDLFIFDELVHNPTSPQAPHNILGYLRVPDIRNLIFTSMDLL